jgi:hypothetical protein
MTSMKPRDRKCLSCRHYQPSPLWRKGWCRNPLLYDPQTNHLVEAESLACSRTFIDYWEPRDGATVADNAIPVDGGPRPVRRAPSIPLTPTGPGGAPLRSSAVPMPLQPPGNIPRPPQLSRVKPLAPPADESVHELQTAPRPLIPPPVPPDPAPTAEAQAAAARPAVRVEQDYPLPEDRTRIQAILSGALLVALLVAAVVLLKPFPNAGTPAATPTVPVPVVAIIPTDTPVPPTATPAPTAVPTPLPPPVMAVGGNAEVTGLASGGGLRVRQTASLNGRIVGAMNNGTRVQIKGGPQTADGVTWWQISGWDAKGTVGWTSGKYLKPVR